MEKEKKNLIQMIKDGGKTTKYLLLGLMSVILIAIACLIIFLPSGKISYSIETSLKEIMENSELSTAEYTYNSITKVKIDESKKEDDENIKYYVSYKGKVKSGFDFNEIKVYEKNKKISIVIPEIKIQSVEVNEDLEYIFTRKKYNTENTYAEAYNVCCNDLENKAKSNKTLRETAVQSAIETVTALTKPFENQLEDGRIIEVKYIDDYAMED